MPSRQEFWGLFLREESPGKKEESSSLLLSFLFIYNLLNRAAVCFQRCRGAGEDGDHEQRSDLRAVGLRGSERRRAVHEGRGLHDHPAARGRRGDRVVVGAAQRQGGLRAPKPAGGE